MNTEKDRIRADRDALVKAIEAAGRTVRGTTFKCIRPEHDDQNASGSIFQHEGAWLAKCHSCGWCGDVFAVREIATGRKVEDQLRELSGEQRYQKDTIAKPATVYPDLDTLKASIFGWERTFKYTSPDDRNRIDLVVVRFRDSEGEKGFIQYHQVGGGFTKGGCPKPWPIYGRPRIRLADTIIVCEGEKCVHAFADVFGADRTITATTSPAGAPNGDKADWRPLAGKRRVIVWPDADAAGLAYARVVVEQLQRLDPPPLSISVIDPQTLDLPEGGDIAEFLDQYGGATPEERRAAVDGAISIATPCAGASDPLREMLNDTIAGRRRAIPWPWRELGRLSKALLPKTLTVVCGEAGASKSLMLFQACEYWNAAGVRVAIFALEDDAPFHLARVLAQADQSADLTDDEWISSHPDLATAAYDRHREQLDAFARVLTVASDGETTHRDVLEWAERQAKAGARIILIDPTTAISSGQEKPWIIDLKFVMQLKRIASEHSVSIIVITHPRKGMGKSMGLDDLAGGAAYTRFSHAVLWLAAHPSKFVTVQSEHGPFTTEINRTLKLVKTRNGPGAGRDLGFHFDPATLCFAEQGVILKKGGSERKPIADPFGPPPASTPQAPDEIW